MVECTGSCKWFDSSKGYGFITTNNGDEVFVHQSEIYARGFRSLAVGEEIECVVIEDEFGKKKATNVKGPNGDFVRGDTDGLRQQPGRQIGGGYNGSSGGRRMGGNPNGGNGFRPNNNRPYRNNYNGSSGGNTGGEYYNGYYD